MPVLSSQPMLKSNRVACRKHHGRKYYESYVQIYKRSWYSIVQVYDSSKSPSSYVSFEMNLYTSTVCRAGVCFITSLLALGCSCCLDLM